MTRTLNVKCYEEIEEITHMQMKIPDDLDLDDPDAVQEFLEEQFCQGSTEHGGHWTKLEGGSSFGVKERTFNIEKVSGRRSPRKKA
jgi:hypothetical protein